jgi:hypothetical protein
MKFTFLLFTFILSFLLLACSSEEKVDLNYEREQVMEVLDNFVKAHEQKDLELLLDCFSDKPDITIIGTDEKELWVDRASMGEAQKQAYETFEVISLSVRDKIVKLCHTGSNAYFYMKVNWRIESEGKESYFEGVRTTGVLEKHNNKWSFVQLHTSLPVAGQAVRY